MSNLGFIDKYLDNANKFYSIAMNQFDLYLKFMGTDVIVLRIKEESIHKEVFGSIYSSDLKGDEDIKQFKYRILLNMNDMRRIYQQSADQFEIYDNRDILKLGDVIVFCRKDKEYKLKVIEAQAFSEASNVLYKYILSGYQEIESL